MSETPSIDVEIARGGRFGFGENWNAFLEVVDEERIRSAEQALVEWLGEGYLRGRTFLDVGSGSGLHSLAAHRLGAAVHSFDYDPGSVACTEWMRAEFADGENWIVERGSVLDRDYMVELPRADVVYSWGVLHHTGDLWAAVDNVSSVVPVGGRLWLALYNDQGLASRLWHRVKRVYCSGPVGRGLVRTVFYSYLFLRGFLGDVRARRNPIARYRTTRERGMSVRHDWDDWLGGLPFEVSKPEEVFEFLHDRGFRLERMTTCAGQKGNNQFLFEREGVDADH